MWEGNRCGVGEEEKVVMEEGGLGDSLLGTRKDGKHSLDRREDVWAGLFPFVGTLLN